MRKTDNKREKIIVFLRKQIPIIRAAAIFTFSIGIFFFIVSHRLFQDWIVNPSSVINAKISTLILQMFGVNVSTQGNSIAGIHGTVSIATGCNGVEALAILFSAILAFPARWKDKIIGFAIGFVGIFIINLFRILGLFIVGQYYPDQIETAHIYVGQTLVIILALGLFLLWAENSSRVRE